MSSMSRNVHFVKSLAPLVFVRPGELRKAVLVGKDLTP